MPSSAMTPWSRTRIRFARRTVESLCAITNTVFPAISRSSASKQRSHINPQTRPASGANEPKTSVPRPLYIASVTGLVDSWLAGSDTEPMIRHALGCAVANASVWDAGAVDPEQAKRFADEVVLEPISRH